MTPAAQARDPILPFADLLDHLRRQGFTIGVDHHLRLRALLNRVAEDCSPDGLKTLLCPILATSAYQQELFHRIFDEWYPLWSAVPERPIAAGTSTAATGSARADRIRRWPYLAAALLALAAAVAFLAPKTQSWIQPAKPKQAAGAPAAGRTASRPPAAPPEPSGAAPGHAHIVGHEISATVGRLPPSYSPALAWYSDHRFALGWTALMGPLAFWVAYEVYRFRRRRLRIRKDRGKTPPYSVTITTGPAPSVYEPHEITGIARLLHRRYAGESDHLDVEATISASIAAAGFPTFRYRKHTRLPEYLVLIDRESFRDHQASLYEQLATLLREHGLFVSTFFFEGDPRTCWSAGSEDAMRLEQLQMTYAGHRLLIFGDCEQLLDAVTGRFAKWRRLFSAWADRAVCTPVPPPDWGMREKVLETEFALFPATLEGLAALGIYLDLHTARDAARWRGSREHRASPFPAADDIPTLRRYLGEPVFQWVCACAVYPELHWNLTLHLAGIPSLPRRLLTEENVLRLLQLRSFRTGWMPDELRRDLLAHIEPRIERQARELIVGFLERTEAPAGTFSEDRHQFQLAYHRYWGNPRDGDSRKRLREALEKAAPEDVAQDHTYLEAAESVSRSPLDFVLPVRLRRKLFPTRMPWLGPRTGVRAAVAILGFAGLLQGLRVLDRKAAAETERYKRLYSAGMALSAREVAGSLRIRWSSAAPAILRAVSGVLRIADGDTSGNYDLELTREQLSAGSATYAPKSRNIAVSLIARDERGNLVSEVTRIQLPPRAATPAPAVKAEAPVRIAGKVFQAPLRPAEAAPLLVDSPEVTMGKREPATRVGEILTSTGVAPLPPPERSSVRPGIRGETPPALLVRGGDVQMVRRDNETALKAHVGEILFTGDRLLSRSKADLLHCPSREIVTLEPSSDVRIDADRLTVLRGTISGKRPVAACVLPQAIRVAVAGQQHYGVSMTRGARETPAAPRDQLPAEVKAELAPLDAVLARNPADPTALVATAVILEKHDLTANAVAAYKNMSRSHPDVLWVKGKIFELEERLAAAEPPVRPTGQTYLVAIGISQYQRLDQSQWLMYAHKDAELFASFFRSPRGGGVPDENVVLLTNEKATTAAVRNYLQLTLQRAGKKDTLIIFIAAHGTVDRGRPFILTFDSDPQDLASTAFPINDLSALVGNYGTRVAATILFLDTCRASALGAIRSTTVNAALERLGEAEGEIFGLMSSRPKELAIEGPQFGGGHGAFTYYLIKGLNGEADMNRDGTVNVNELIEYVRDAVSQATGGRQHPRDFGAYSYVLSDAMKPGIQLAEPDRVQSQKATRR